MSQRKSVEYANRKKAKEAKVPQSYKRRRKAKPKKNKRDPMKLICRGGLVHRFGTIVLVTGNYFAPCGALAISTTYSKRRPVTCLSCMAMNNEDKYTFDT